MSNPNTVTVYSPEGEPFEMSRVNARDLCNHRDWSMSPPEGTVTPTPVEEVAEEVEETEAEVETEAEEEADDAGDDSEGSVEDAADETEEAEADEAEATEEDAAEAEVTEEAEATDEAEETDEAATAEATVFTTEEEFAHLESREDVVAYLAGAFPDFKPHHKSSRDGLVAKAIELAAE